MNSALKFFRRLIPMTGVLVLTVGWVSSLSAQTAIFQDPFTTLEEWESPSLSQEASREIVNENSAFSDVIPANGKSVKLVDTGNSAHTRFLLRPISSVGGKLIFSFDFKLLSEGDTASEIGGLTVILMNDNQSVTNFIARFLPSINLNIGRSKTDNFRAKPEEKLQWDTWYTYRANLDLDNKTLSAQIRSEHGDTIEIPELLIPNPANLDPLQIDTVRIGSASGAQTKSPPILLDNFSLQSAEN